MIIHSTLFPSSFLPCSWLLLPVPSWPCGPKTCDPFQPQILTSILESPGSHPSHAPVHSFISKLFSAPAWQRSVLSSSHGIPGRSCAILKSLKLCEAEQVLSPNLPWADGSCSFSSSLMWLRQDLLNADVSVYDVLVITLLGVSHKRS